MSAGRPRGGDIRLRRLLGGAETAWLRERLRRRIAAGSPLTGTVTLARPTPEQRRAMESLLGRPPSRGASLRVALADVDAALRRSGVQPDGLAAAVVELLGPIPDAAAVRAATAAGWERATAALAAVCSERAELGPWYADPRTGALIRRLGGDPESAASLLAALVSVLAALPAAGVPLARFAAERTGDPHALDTGRPLATLVLSAVRATWWREDGDRNPTGYGGWTPAQWRRALWDRVGVLVDELSSLVLALNLPVVPGTALHRFTEPARETGEPLVLTLRQLTREEFRSPARSVFVCENPAVVAAAADALGPTCPPLVCVNGQPTMATLRLLDAVRRDGATLAYHGDFDWGGIRIANLLHDRLGWRPWRYDAASYRAAVAGRTPGRMLDGPAVEALWDPALAGAMRENGRRVEEESVLDDLLDDLLDARPD
jgi:uncharacterized protein (TIGR02679 family)